MSEQDKQVWILTTDAADTGMDGARAGDDIGGGFGARATSAIVRRIAVSADDLRDQMGSLLAVVDHVFDQARAMGNLQLEEIELSVDINSEGGISIIGTGAKVAGHGGVKLQFKRNQMATLKPTEVAKG
jgi:hypothetical protein